MWNKQLIIFLVFLFLSHLVQAQVYKCENDSGEINFSDEPCPRGETVERLDWLKGTTSSKKTKKSTYRSTDYISKQAKVTAKKARKNNEAYVLLSLLTTTQLELETASLKSTTNGETTSGPELLLSDGITVDLLKVDKIIISYKGGNKELQARFVMADGYEEVKAIKKPFPKISGSAKIGRFSKSLADIKQIEFFNSQKLLKATKKNKAKQHSSASKQSVKKVTASKQSIAKNETPVIELDLSHQVPATSNKAVSNPQLKVVESSSSKKTVKNPQIKVIGKTSSKHSSAPGVHVDLINDKKLTLKKEGLASSKGSQKSRAMHFLVSGKEQIPYDAIKTIKVRPTSKKQLIVAVELKSKEIKMEVMSPPFTRITGQSSAGAFDYSLSEIKSINF